MRYGDVPAIIGEFQVDCKEMMFYQYLPIKMSWHTIITFEDRLRCFDEITGVACCDFVGSFGLDKYVKSYLYLTAKYMFQQPGNSFNRQGYHSDGFLTDDINYVWCDKHPTVFNTSDFRLTSDDTLSQKQMIIQSSKKNNVTYPDNTLLRLNQYNIHKVNEVPFEGMRTFLKLSFSEDKYDLIGNSHNHLLNYDWEMKERKLERNIPQSSLNV